MNRKEQIFQFAEKTEAKVKKIHSLLTRKSVKRGGLLLVTLFFVLQSLPVLAQAQEVKIDGAMSYDSCTQNKETQGYDGQTAIEKDQGLVGCGNVVTTLLHLLSSIFPDFLVGGILGGQGVNEDGVNTIATTGLFSILDGVNGALLYNPPTVDVAGHMAKEWVPGQDAHQTSIYAQSTGADYLTETNIEELWGKTRTLAYSLFVIVLIIAGFMIMFRQKIGGQMAVTIFNTLPKVIIGLILVTFSFAIVGLIIDFGILLNNVIISFLDIGDPVVISNPFSLVGVLFRGENGMGGLSSIFGGAIAVGGLGILLGILFPPAAGVAITGGILALVLAFAIAAIVVYASIKVFITLLKAWVGIIVDTILGPLFLVVAVIPGRSSVGWNWFFRVVKNVLTFVGVFLLINLAGYLYAMDVEFFFPSGLTGGEAGGGSMAGPLGLLMDIVLPLFLFFMAAEVPNFLDDFIPKDGGKGAATAFGGVQKSFSKVPVVGSAFS